MSETNYFETLSKIQCETDKITMGSRSLTYVTWSEAWSKLKMEHPNATYTIHTDAGLPFFTNEITKSIFVSVAVKVNDIEHTMVLPVLDNRNDAPALDKVNSFMINKAIMRCFTKAIAMHGIGLYVYKGEDLPEGGESKAEEKKEETKPAAKGYACSDCGEEISAKVASYSSKNFGSTLCMECQRNAARSPA